MEKEARGENSFKGRGITRGKFIKISALLGGSTLLAGFGNGFLGQDSHRVWGSDAYELGDPENIIITTCQQCNTQCGIKVKILDGVIAKIDGNPYSPWTMAPHLDYQTPVTEAASVDGAICPKGQAGMQTTYDPYRLVKVIKRDGPRGSNKWISIPFDQAITEITEGGNLFANVPGEENRNVTGLKDIWAMRDPVVMAAMKKDVDAIWAETDPAKKASLVTGFKVKHQAYLDELIDPDHPDLGPKNNQFNFMWGRLKGGRGDLIKRFTAAMGSVNKHGHTTVCQGSLYFSGKALSEQFNAQGGFSGSKKFYWHGDAMHSEFIIFTGASLLEGNYPTLRAKGITDGLVNGRLKFVVVDPRFSKLAAKSWKWLPAKPGSEGAMALALIRWILENKRYDARFLSNANKAAATADGEPSWCNAAWLVKLDETGRPTRLLRGSDVGIDNTSFSFDPPLVMNGDQMVPFDPNSTVNAVEGELWVDKTLNGHRVKSSLQVLWDEASSHTLSEWAEICDVKASVLEEVALEFTSHGKKAVADIHRGVSQHTNGFYNAVAWWNLNMLIGNIDWQGGLIVSSTYGIDGSKAGGPFKLGDMKPGALSPFGISIIRHGRKYEDTTLYQSEGYPAKRNWYPLSSDIYQEIIPSAGDGYPYPLKALFLYMGSPVYSLPAGHTNLEILANPNKIPLVVASDILVGETSMYADYIFPDLTNMERWEFCGSQPSVPFKVQPVRQPAVAPLVETVQVFGKSVPISLETMLLAIAEKLGLPTFGTNGLGQGRPLVHQDDLYLPMVANLAYGEKADGSDAVPDADTKEIQIFVQARRHLPSSVFDEARWRGLVGDKLWPKVVYVLNRGGRFQELAKGAMPGGQTGNPYGRFVNMFQEKTAGVKNSQTGLLIPGWATYISAPRDIAGKVINDEGQGYDLRLITFREISQCKSRTISNHWLTALLPENSLIINQSDADLQGLKDGDLATVISATNTEGVYDLKNGQKWPMTGKVKVVQGMRPGVVAFSLGHGHFAYGGLDITIDGQIIKGEKRRVAGVHANAAMRIDPILGNTCLVDTVGGSAVFYDTQVRLEKVSA